MPMQLRLFIAALVLVALTFAVAGWTVEGIRWTFTGSRKPGSPRPRVRPA